MMRVLFCHRPGGAWGYITDGMINALRDKGHDVRRWDNQGSTWDEFDPDIYVGCSGHKQDIPANRRAKIAIHVNPWGPNNIHGISESEQNINWTLRQKPNAVFGYGYDADRILWAYWPQRGKVPWVPMPTAGDKVIYKLLPQADRSTDIVYLGGIWTYKAITINEFLLPVLKSGLSYKLYGWGDWPSGMCGGVLPDDKVCAFFNSGKVAPCISERHTRSYGIDMPERAFKVALCGALAVHDAIPRIDGIIDGIVTASDAKDYKSKCQYYCHPDNSDERAALVNRQREHILKHHTYHHRMGALLRVLGFEEEAVRMTDG